MQTGEKKCVMVIGVALWRSCYATSYAILTDTEARTPQKLREAITHVLSDQPRSGAPSTFTQEQAAGIPSRWDSLSAIGPPPFSSGWQKGRGLSRPYWSVRLAGSTQALRIRTGSRSMCLGSVRYPCHLKRWRTREIHVTGIQAREHKNPKKLMEPGKPERVDPEYIRHGTTGLITSRNIATGKIVAPLIQPTRTEEDFARHIREVIEIELEKVLSDGLS